MAKAGKIYLEIARGVLVGNPNISEETGQLLLEHADLDELEEILQLIPDISQVFRCLALQLSLRRKPVPSDEFIRYILLENAADGLPNRAKDKLRKIPPEQQGEIALDVVRSMHTSWVQTHEADFGAEYCLDDWYRFMAIELIGWEDVQDYLVYIRPIMASMGMDGILRRRFHSQKELTPEGDYIREAYRRAQKTLRTMGSITTIQSYSRFFRDLDRHGYSCSNRVDRVLQSNEDVLIRVAAQVLQHNPRDTFCHTSTKDE